MAAVKLWIAGGLRNLGLFNRRYLNQACTWHLAVPQPGDDIVNIYIIELGSRVEQIRGKGGTFFVLLVAFKIDTQLIGYVALGPFPFNAQAPHALDKRLIESPFRWRGRSTHALGWL